MELKIGHHLSISKGFPDMISQAKTLGMNIFSCMIGNPHTGKFIPRNKTEIIALNSAIKEGVIKNFIVHCPYTFNLASKNDFVRERTVSDMKKIIPYLDLITNSYYVLHPGCHTGNGIEKGIKLIRDSLNQIMTKDMKTTILLETMAGKGTEIGNFESLEKIISNLKYPEHIGICFDTCHVWDAGYDLSNFEKIISELKARNLYNKILLIHFNDSKNDCGSHKDRHENIGYGKIGTQTLKDILNYKDFLNLPFILETEREDEQRLIKEIKMLKEWRNDINKKFLV